jgi:hypothetical protein
MIYLVSQRNRPEVGDLLKHERNLQPRSNHLSAIALATAEASRPGPLRDLERKR